MNIESYVLDHIEERKKDPILKGVLSTVSLFFRTGVAIRHVGYDKGWLKSYKASVPVVSVGNIAAGGTGKTPLIRLLAEALSDEKVAILVRGYRAQVKGDSIDISQEGAAEGAEYGDEATWLHKNLPGVPIWVGKNRVRSAEFAAKQGAHVLLLDDGMQHRALARDVEIVILDGEDLFAKGSFLPRGLLRDFPSRLKEAHLIVLSHVHTQEQYEKCVEKIRLYSSAPIAAMRYRFMDGESLKGKPVGVFCALGRPERFVQMLKREGCNIIDTIVAADHIAFEERQLQAYAKRCKMEGAEFLVCTEKDAVKLSPSMDLVLPVRNLVVEIVWTEGEHLWKECVQNIKKRLRAHAGI
ncbi:MAG: tetraacyldisaccharide 4'-kinase [Chlamydiales bacterium]